MAWYGETIAKFLDDLSMFPVGRVIKRGEDLEQSLSDWGFTMYRTYYGPGSDEKWSELIQSIVSGVHERLHDLDGTEEDPDAYIKACDLFRLDSRSDPATLDGLTLEGVRQLWLEGSGGQPMNAENDRARAPWRVFLLADAEVLREPKLDKIKVAAADYDPVTAVPKYERQRYFGWITMPTWAVLDLYRQLDFFSIGYLGRNAPGGFWDPEND